MRALAVARNDVDAGEPRVRPAIALVRDVGKIQVSGLAVTGQGGSPFPTHSVSRSGGPDTNPFEIDLSYWSAGFHVVPAQRLAHEERARLRGYEIPPQRTLAQLETACAAEEIRLRKLEKMAAAEVIPFPQLPPGPFASPCLPKPLTASSGAPTGRAIPAKDAAEQFLSWLQSSALIGAWSSEDMSKFYSRFCAESHIRTPENVMRGELAKPRMHIQGARREKDDHRVKGQGRKRPVVWKIELAPSQKRRAS